VVGIGASAGGLETLEALTRLASDHMACIVVQHLAPVEWIRGDRGEGEGVRPGLDHAPVRSHGGTPDAVLGALHPGRG